MEETNYYEKAVHLIRDVEIRLVRLKQTQASEDLRTALSCLEEVAVTYNIETNE
jgi:hypothetical protein